MLTTFINESALTIREIFSPLMWNVKKLSSVINNIYLVKNVKDIPRNEGNMIEEKTREGNMIEQKTKEEKTKEEKIKYQFILKIYPSVSQQVSETGILERLKGEEGFPQLLYYNKNRKFPFSIMTKIEGIDLFEYRELYGNFSENELKPILLKIFFLVKKLHNMNIIHGDLKPENIIYNDKTEELTIIDFELGRYSSEYASPEQLNSLPLTPKSDIWSLGVLIYTLLQGLKLFENISDTLSRKIRYPRMWSSELVDLVDSMLELKTSFRFNIEECINHHWFHPKKI